MPVPDCNSISPVNRIESQSVSPDCSQAELNRAVRINADHDAPVRTPVAANRRPKERALCPSNIYSAGVRVVPPTRTRTRETRDKGQVSSRWRFFNRTQGPTRGTIEKTRGVGVKGLLPRPCPLALISLPRVAVFHARDGTERCPYNACPMNINYFSVAPDTHSRFLGRSAAPKSCPPRTPVIYVTIPR